METNAWNRCSELRRRFIEWILFYNFFCTAAVFISSLVTCYHLVELVVVSVLTCYITETLASSNENRTAHLLLNAATLNKVHGGLKATFEVILIFISDSHIGGFKTVLFSSASFIAGLTMLAFWKENTYSGRLVLNTIAIFFMAIGSGGKETLTKFKSEQIRAKEPTEQPKEDRVMARTRVWYRATWLLAAVISLFLFRNFGWSKTFGYSASAMAFSYLVFISGICFYHREEATSRKHDMEASTGTAETKSSFHQLIQEGKSESVIRFLLPAWGFSIILGIGLSTADTFFQQQALDLKFPFDITALLVLQAISGRGFSFLYDFIVSKCQPAESRKSMRHWIKIWIGMFLMVACLLVGWRVDRYAWENGENIPNLALWLSLQFLLLGPAKTFAEDGLNDLLEQHLGDELKKYAPSLNGFAIGCLGNFSSIILLQVRRHWFPHDLESIHLDKYYLLVAILNFVNLSSSILWKILSDGRFCCSGATVYPNPPPDVEPPVAGEEAIQELVSYLVN